MSVIAALGIAKAIGLTDWVTNKLSGSDNNAAKIAAKVINYASDVTGEKDKAAIEQQLSANPELAAKLKQTLLDNEHEIDMAPYKDRANARQMYTVHNSQADKIADRVIKFNPLYILLCLIAQTVALLFLRDQATLLSLITSVLTMAIKSFFDERKEVTGFYFGSSMGSKNKDLHKDAG